jgi:hypothetical protein
VAVPVALSFLINVDVGCEWWIQREGHICGLEETGSTTIGAGRTVYFCYHVAIHQGSVWYNFASPVEQPLFFF